MFYIDYESTKKRRETSPMGLFDNIQNGIASFTKNRQTKDLNNAASQAYSTATEIAQSVQKGKSTAEILDDIDYIVNKKEMPIAYTLNLDYTKVKPGIDNHFTYESVVEGADGFPRTITTEAIDDTIKITANKNENGDIEYHFYNRRGDELEFDSRESLIRYIDDFGGISKDLTSLEDKENIITDILRESQTFADKIKAIKMVAPYYNEDGGKIYLPLRYAESAINQSNYGRSKEDYIKNPRLGITADQQFLQITFNKNNTQDLAIGFMSDNNGKTEFEQSLLLGKIQEPDELLINQIKENVSFLEKGAIYGETTKRLAAEKLEEVQAGFVPNSIKKEGISYNGTILEGYNEYDIAKEHFGNLQVTGLALNAITLSDHYLGELVNSAVQNIKETSKFIDDNPYGRSALVDTIDFTRKGEKPLVNVTLTKLAALDFSNRETPEKKYFASEIEMAKANKESIFNQLTTRYQEYFKYENKPIPTYQDYLAEVKAAEEKAAASQSYLAQYNKGVVVNREQTEIDKTLSRYINLDLTERAKAEGRIFNQATPWENAPKYNIGVINQYEKSAECFDIYFEGKAYKDIEIKKTENDAVRTYRDNKEGQIESFAYMFEGNDVFKKFTKDFINESTVNGTRSEVGVRNLYNTVYETSEILENNISNNSEIKILNIRPDRNAERIQSCLIDRDLAVKKGGGFELRGVMKNNLNKLTIDMDHKIECDINYVATQLADKNVIEQITSIKDDRDNNLTGNYPNRIVDAVRKGDFRSLFDIVTGKQAKIYKMERIAASNSAKTAASYLLAVKENRLTPDEMREKFGNKALRDFKAMAMNPDIKRYASLVVRNGNNVMELIASPNGNMAVIENNNPPRLIESIKEQQEYAMAILAEKSAFIERKLNKEIEGTKAHLESTVNIVFNERNDLSYNKHLGNVGQIREDLSSEISKYDMKIRNQKELKGLMKTAENNKHKGGDER